MIETLAISVCVPILFSAVCWLLLNSYRAVAYTVASVSTGDSNGDGKLGTCRCVQTTLTESTGDSSGDVSLGDDQASPHRIFDSISRPLFVL